MTFRSRILGAKTPGWNNIFGGSQLTWKGSGNARMANSSIESTGWKPVTLSSTVAVSLCLAFGYIGVGSHFTFDLTNYYGTVFVVGAVAAVCACIGVIGWARHLGRGARVSLAIAVLVWPWTILLIGYPLAGTNIHGPAAPVLILIWPASILSLVLFIMAGVAKKDA